MRDQSTHRAAVAQTLSWAHVAAARGDYADALAWLATLDAIGHELSRDDERLREAWRGVLAARTTDGYRLAGPSRALTSR